MKWTYNVMTRLGMGMGTQDTNLAEDARSRREHKIPVLHIARGGCTSESDSRHLALLALVQGGVVLGTNYTELSWVPKITYDRVARRHFADIPSSPLAWARCAISEKCVISTLSYQ